MVTERGREEAGGRALPSARKKMNGIGAGELQ